MRINTTVHQDVSLDGPSHIVNVRHCGPSQSFSSRIIRLIGLLGYLDHDEMKTLRWALLHHAAVLDGCPFARTILVQ
jgi:hypothetical protein